MDVLVHVDVVVVSLQTKILKTDVIEERFFTDFYVTAELGTVYG